MSSTSDILESFQFVGIFPTDQILEKCRKLCQTYNFQAEDFVDQWCAYSASHLCGEPPTLDTLDQLERKELQKLARNPKPKPSKYVADPPEVDIQTTPKRPANKKIVEPSPNQSPSVAQVETEFNHQNTPSQRYAERSDARSVLCEYGECTTGTFKQHSNDVITIKLRREEPPDHKYMFERMGTRAQIVNDIAWSVSNGIINYYGLELSEEPFINYSGEMTVFGRIYPEYSQKLTADSVYLEGSIETNKGHRIKLNVANLHKLAVFSGQVVVVVGNNLKGTINVKQLYVGAPLSFPETPLEIHEPLQIVVAAGPFTLPDNLLYEPLNDLIKYVVEYQPNVLILMGPFLDESHPLLKDLNENYESYFERLVSDVMAQLEGTYVKVILIPSPKDIHHHVIFPTLPYVLPKHPRLTLAENPCVVDINGLLIGATPVDVLFHLNRTELSIDKQMRVSGDRMPRLASHILNQHSFYPLHPPDPDVRIDYQLFDSYGMLEVSPHLMFLPSNFRYFVKKVDGCLVINPERLTKGNVAGSFARLEVRPGDGHICDRVACQIMRV